MVTLVTANVRNLTEALADTKTITSRSNPNGGNSN